MCATQLEQVARLDRFRSQESQPTRIREVLAVLFEAARAVNRIAGGADSAATPSTASLEKAKKEICESAANILGILTEEPSEFLEGIRTGGGADLGLTEQEIEALIVERADARKNKDFARADQIRNELKDKGILLEDGPTGTTWKVGDS